MIKLGRGVEGTGGVGDLGGVAAGRLASGRLISLATGFSGVCCRCLVISRTGVGFGKLSELP